MQIKNIRLNEYYRHKDHPNIGWAKPIEILQPKKKGNTSTITLVKCEWTSDKNSSAGLIKYFRPSVLVEETK